MIKNEQEKTGKPMRKETKSDAASKLSEKEGGYLRPKAAYRKMQTAAGIRQTIWCWGVCGTGKTSFVKDYLKRRRYDYYSAKEVIPEQVKIPKEGEKTTIVVIDDLYGIAETDLQGGWLNCIDTMVKREDIWLILISRSDIPLWLHGLAIQNAFYRIDEEELLLTKEQMETYFEQCGYDLEETTKQRIWELGAGNPMWCRICAMEFEREKNEKLAIEHAQVSIWKFFNRYVYDQWDSEIVETVMKLSILQEFDLDMAVYMTGNRNVNVVLTQAMEVGNFMTMQGEKWVIRIPLCQSMEQRLNRNYGTDYIKSLYVRAGDAFRIKGKLVEALRMYEKAKDERSIAELLIQNARENPATGHYYEMKHYYLHLSEKYIRQSVELMGAMSMLQSILMNEEESERWYNELKLFAKTQSGSLKREAANKLLYLDIALPHRGSEGLVSLLKHAGSLVFHRQAKLPELSVTSNLPSMMNGGKDFCEWSKKDRELAAGIGKIVSFVLGRYGKGLVSLALAESGLEKGCDNYEVETLAVRGRMEAEAGGKLEQCFVGTGILVWLSIFTNHPDHAATALDGMYKMMSEEKVSPQMIRNFHTLQCRLALYQGRKEQVSEWMKEAPRQEEEFYTMDRFGYLTKVRVYLGECMFDKTAVLLQKLDFYAHKMKRTYIQMETKLLQAILFYRMKNERWMETLQDAITQAEEYHFVRLFSREGAALLPLLKKGKFCWQDTGFQKQVIEETTHMAQLYPSYLASSVQQSEVVLADNAVKILRLQSLGKSTAEIASLLAISEATVKYHNRETYKKLGVKTKAQAVSEAKNRNLI